MEILDVYDQNKKKTGKTIERTYPINIGHNEFYLCVRCWIITQDNKVLIIQRNANKIHGEKWENIGGCAKKGENSREAIKREVNEEIGLNIDEREFKILKEEQGENFFKDIYYSKLKLNINDISICEDEVMNFKIVSIDELKLLVDKNEFSAWSVSSLKQLYKMLET